MMDLQLRWRDCLSACGIGWVAADAVWSEIAAAYAEPSRHYHNRAHIEVLLGLAHKHRDALHEPATVDLAIFFHDAVYDVRRSDNEVLSAQLAKDRLAGLGVSDAIVARVAALIDMTRHGAIEPATGDTDAHHFLDFDLSVLGASPPLYGTYAAAIRREYAHVSEADYRQGRARVLGGFLGRPTIYRVAALRKLWEASARTNLAHEIAALAQVQEPLSSETPAATVMSS
jgi:predicted metal-dependent HD superfamily phosphohydrolase